MVFSRNSGRITDDFRRPKFFLEMRSGEPTPLEASSEVLGVRMGLGGGVGGFLRGCGGVAVADTYHRDIKGSQLEHWEYRF